MKKILFLSITLLSVFLVGCGNKQRDYEKTMEKYALDFYEKYVEESIGDQVDVPQITIENLKAANAVKEQYDLTKLKNCKDSSYVSFIMKDKKIDLVEFHMNCK